jgi:murein DD-endopeptidase MepM/ murein hydrolase activator NlpD
MVLRRALVIVVVLLGALVPQPVSGAARATGGTDPVGQWPLAPAPEVVRGFDPPDLPWGSGHRGVDLFGTPGQRVRAAMAGRVSFAAVLAGRGVVVVDHGATRTTYEPVMALVAVGTQVAAGEVIGTLELGASHCFPAACLHWGWRRGERYLDPLLLVGLAPVRLLPLDRPAPTIGSSWGHARGWACW